MGERRSWVGRVGLALAAAVGLLSAGCGAYGEADYPQPYYEAPSPPTNAELAAQAAARQQAAAENREILIGADEDEYADTDPSALTEFRPALEGHGEWIDDSTYGTVWVPSAAEVGTDFQPYVTAGHWTYSDTTDYVWVSDYSWGWAPFHYGRWVLLPGHGWAWIPGRRYAGAWVSWRVGPSGYGYVGWAPLGPSWYWYRGTAVGWTFGHYRPHDHYVYCARESMYQGAVSTHVVRGPAARVHDGRTQDYVAASPAVGGPGRVVASPTVGDGERVLANPGVGSGSAVAASPGLSQVGGAGGARVAATPAVARGPRPGELGMKNDVVVAPPSNHPGLERAQTYALPKSAVSVGAAAPAHVRPNAVPGPRATPAAEAFRAPATPSLVPRGDLQRNVIPRSEIPRSDAPAIREAPRASVQAVPRYRPSPSVSSPLPAYRASPSVGSSPAFRSSPPSAFRASPRITASPASPHIRSAPPTFRSSPAITASPHVRSAPPSAFRSSPAIRSSPSFSSSPAIRSAPSSSFRASPSIRSPGLSSAPSRSASPAIRSMARPGVRR